MKYIERAISDRFLKCLIPNKVLVLLGPRRVGKTSLLKHLATTINEPILQLNGEDIATVEVLKQRTVENYKRLLGNYSFLIIDEAQKIPNIALILKLIVDEIDGIKIIVTGSSMFDLTNQLGEPLTGRKITFQIYPLAQMEYQKEEHLVQTKSNLEERLIYGSYPELQQYSSNEEKTTYLRELVSSYLLKDILEYDGIRSSGKLIDLLRLIAFQIGKEVSFDELSKQLGISRNTVERYLDLLSKVFVVYKLQGFSRNLRKEVTKSSKWYFFDNGIRNALIANFNSINLRNDVGELWENYLLSERIKYQQYNGMVVNNYFWRTYQQQEIDWVEEREGALFAYELKWKSEKKVKIPSAWRDAYSDSKFEVMTSEKYLDWIC